MIPNEALYILANRKGPFPELGVPIDDSFNPLTLDQDQSALHQALFLDFAGNDHYLAVYFSAILSVPDLAYYIHGPMSFDLSKTLPTGAVVTGGKFVQIPPGKFVQVNTDGSAQVNPGGTKYLGIDHNLPLGFTYRINYVSDTVCRILVEESGVSSVAELIQNPTGTLLITWPPGMPFVGPIVLDQPWTRSCGVRIEVRPSEFPYDKLIARVRNLPYTSQLLRQVQLTTEFAFSMDDVERTAYLLVALILTRKAQHIDLTKRSV